MTTAHFVKKAQKDYPEFGIKKGDSYWHWAFAFGPKYKSKTQPTRSQLTRSPSGKNGRPQNAKRNTEILN